MLELTSKVVYSFVQLYLLDKFDEPVATPELHKEIWEYACSPKRFVAIAAPRGFAKSTALTHSYVLANVAFRVKDHVLIVSDTQPQSILFLGDIKRELVENEALRQDFGFKKIVKETETEIIGEFQDGKQFRIIARGSGQDIRGLKWRNKRPNLIVGDDLENDDIVLNDSRREKFEMWFLNALLNCGSKNCHVRIVGTILHFDSLLAGLMPDETLNTTRITPLKTYSVDEDKPWLSVLYRAHPAVGDFSQLLWEDQWPKERLLVERAKYAHRGRLEGYAQEYLNNPIDSSTAYFQSSDIVPISASNLDETKREPEEYYIGVDMAISEKDKRAYTVFMVAGLSASNILRIRDVRRFRGDGNQIIETMFSLHRRWSNPLFIIEQENIAKSLGGVINHRMMEEGVFLNIHEVTPIQDKQKRARAMQARMRVGAIEFDEEAEWYGNLQQEILRFPAGRYMDQVDALAWICFTLDQLTPALTEDEINQNEYDDEYEDTYLFAPQNEGRDSTTGY
tara:strand:- start:1985 stop:3511 length:1527 start_codon:yes stop_codon:yes gene_type:complete